MRKTPLEAVHELDIAFNQRDLNATLSFYEDDATIVIEPGKPVIKGKVALQEAFIRAFTLKGTATQLKTHVIESGDLALFTSKWIFEWTSSNSLPMHRESIATTVFRKAKNEEWLIVIDN
jgi:ketosteroid isomerase-like protein